MMFENLLERLKNRTPEETIRYLHEKERRENLKYRVRYLSRYGMNRKKANEFIRIQKGRLSDKEIVEYLLSYREELGIWGDVTKEQLIEYVENFHYVD